VLRADMFHRLLRCGAVAGPSSCPIHIPFDINPDPTRTAIVLPWEGGPGEQSRSAEACLAEAVELAGSIGLQVLHTATVPLRTHRPATLLGQGKVASLCEVITEHAIELVVVDAALNPAQQRNLKREWGCKVIDRTGLILDIFGERARTREGAFQVELAHLRYQRSRLHQCWEVDPFQRPDRRCRLCRGSALRDA